MHNPNISLDHINGLKIIHRICTQERYNWVVAGSLSLALQGIDINTSDIDILVSEKTAYSLEEKLVALPNCSSIRQVAYSAGPDPSDAIYKSHFGIVQLDSGALIDIMGDCEERTSEGWISLNHRLTDFLLVKVDEILVPVSKLEHQQTAYATSLRPNDCQKAKMIQEYLLKLV